MIVTTPSRACLIREPENHARSFQSPTINSLFVRRIQRRLPFLQDWSFSFFNTPQFLKKTVSDATYPKSRPFCRMKLRYLSETGFAIFFVKFKLKFGINGIGRGMRLKKKATSPLGESGPDFPVPRFKHACASAETSTSIIRISVL